MKNNLTLLIISIFILSGCGSRDSGYKTILSGIADQIAAGNLLKAESSADSLMKNTRDERIQWTADSLRQIAERTAIDFPVTYEQIKSDIEKKLGKNVTADEIVNWERSGWLEYRIIEGEKRYFNRAASNLLLLMTFHLNRSSGDSLASADQRLQYRKKHTLNIIGSSSNRNSPVNPVTMEITYTITVNPDAVPEGETVRCWLPFPKENNIRQSEVYLLGVSDEEYFVLAPDSVAHRSIYMEKKAVKGEPVVFQAAWSFTSSGQYFDPARIKTQPYNKRSALYRKYTAEQLPQISFTENVRKLADSIAGNEQNPYETVKKIYYWFNMNIPWAGALEYSIMPNIPEYVIANRRGDCGMQIFLLMSMLRYKGIPVKWQSGWMTPPVGKNLHDWCEVYYEGTGWVPLDISYNLQFSPDLKTREFYITGIDSYRLIINDGIAGKLYPEKKFLRSEPYDFQRGEVEWRGGNLYFDKWDYNMKIEYK